LARRPRGEAARARWLARQERIDNARLRRECRRWRTVARYGDQAIWNLICVTFLLLYEFAKLLVLLARSLVVAAFGTCRSLAKLVGRVIHYSCRFALKTLQTIGFQGIALTAELSSRLSRHRSSRRTGRITRLFVRVREIRYREVYGRLLASYSRLPEWGQPIVWGLLASIPIVVGIIAIRMAW
jgi:hypothetical protein